MKKLAKNFKAMLNDKAMEYLTVNRKYLLFLVLLALLYITNGLMFALDTDKREMLESKLSTCKVKYNLLFSEYSSLAGYSNLRVLLRKHGLNDLRESDVPPVRIGKDEIEN
ncbi:MAG: hypothetical protein LBD35_00150 [Prevotellaceae bacterium]|jgi:hypothetical protein|nr:hypothetical protein [Prevotellaceae bacterium]